jgi:hypothetical protein
VWRHFAVLFLALLVGGVGVGNATMSSTLNPSLREADMQEAIRAGAWCNGEVAYLAWDMANPLPDCLGFMVTRVHETGADAGQRRVLPTWLAFNDQSNPHWIEQDSSVWPTQSFQWRDLTLRRSRNTTAVRPIGFAVHYEIVPVGPDAPRCRPRLLRITRAPTARPTTKVPSIPYS